MRIVIATGNPHKVDEIRAVLEPMGFAVVSLQNLVDRFQQSRMSRVPRLKKMHASRLVITPLRLARRCLPMTADWKWTRSKERPASTVRTGLAPKVRARTAMRATTRSWWV